jgi:hypothetical protein
MCHRPWAADDCCASSQARVGRGGWERGGAEEHALSEAAAQLLLAVRRGEVRKGRRRGACCAGGSSSSLHLDSPSPSPLPRKKTRLPRLDPLTLRPVALRRSLPGVMLTTVVEPWVLLFCSWALEHTNRRWCTCRTQERRHAANTQEHQRVRTPAGQQCLTRPLLALLLLLLLLLLLPVAACTAVFCCWSRTAACPALATACCLPACL